MFRITREFHFCYGHRLLDYEGKCRHLHGHNGKAVVTLEGRDLDARGMVMDFTDLKRGLGAWIDATMDHKMLLRRDDPVLAELQRRGEPVVIMDANPTAENIAKLIFEQAQSMGFPVVVVSLWETENCCATYGQAMGHG